MPDGMAIMWYTLGTKIFVYPADSVIGGPIEERTVVADLGRKVMYDKEDQYGYIGAKKSGVFSTMEEAEEAKRRDA